jgi:hypothetical protein
MTPLRSFDAEVAELRELGNPGRLSSRLGRDRLEGVPVRRNNRQQPHGRPRLLGAVGAAAAALWSNPARRAAPR